jgi:four helix bundle protein
MSNYNIKKNIIMEKSKAFALRIIKLYNYLCKNKKEYIIAKQLLKSGTSIGANVKEAQCAQSKKDFTAKMYIAFKEANETEYWLELLYDSDYINDFEFDSIKNDNEELLKLLTSITKTMKNQ